MSCKYKHHECGFETEFCCGDCGDYQIGICIENNKVCDCLWDEDLCSLDKDTYISSIPCEKSYHEHLDNNKPNCFVK